MSGPGHYDRNHPVASEEAKTEAREVVRIFKATYLPKKGGPLTVYKPVIRRIIKTCDAFLVAFEPNTRAPLSKSKRRIDLTVYVGKRSTASSVLDDVNCAIIAVKELKAGARAARDALSEKGRFSTLAIEQVIRELAGIWETDTGKKPSQTWGGPFCLFVEQAFHKNGMTLTKPRLESALKARRQGAR